MPSSDLRTSLTARHCLRAARPRASVVALTVCMLVLACTAPALSELGPWGGRGGRMWMPPGAAPQIAHPDMQPVPADHWQSRLDPPQPAGPTGAMVLYLDDGSILVGEPAAEALTIATPYGQLTIPVSEVQAFQPGVARQPQLLAQADRWIAVLSNSDPNTADAAAENLMSLDPRLLPVLERIASRYAVDPHANRTTELLTRMLAEMSLEPDPKNWRTWHRTEADVLLARQLRVVGTLVQDTITLRTQQGNCTVPLRSITGAERLPPPPVVTVKQYEVTADHLTGRKPLDTNRHLRSGDRVRITATGSLEMTPWGKDKSATPDGSQQFNWYVQPTIPGGALVGQLDANGSPYMVGSQRHILIKRAGVLHLAIAMHSSYTADSHKFPGKYTVIVRIESKHSPLPPPPEAASEGSETSPAPDAPPTTQPAATQPTTEPTTQPSGDEASLSDQS